MNRQNGAARIFLYNWPIYVGTWTATLIAFGAASALSGATRAFALLGGAIAIAWSLASLLISRHIYDRSPLVAGRWIPGILAGSSPAEPLAWATIHAGLDAEIALDDAMPGRCIARLDIFDRETMTSPSIARARLRTPSVTDASPCNPSTLSLHDESCDVIVVAFTAHEIRVDGVRASFFEELRRSLRIGGKILIVEHLRDLANFCAFGPGFLHFASRHEWLRVARRANLHVASEIRVTPWVMALVLERRS